MDSGEIDKALITRLSGDATLAGLLPDGVWMNEAAQGKRNFAVVSLVIGEDAGAFTAAGRKRATEDCLYLVKAVTLGSSRTLAGQAAKRIDELLDDAPLTITGYHCASIKREERVDLTEVDSVDASIRWQHRGGRYRLLAVPL